MGSVEKARKVKTKEELAELRKQMMKKKHTTQIASDAKSDNPINDMRSLNAATPKNYKKETCNSVKKTPIRRKEVSSNNRNLNSISQSKLPDETEILL